MYCVSEQVAMYWFTLCALHLLHVGQAYNLHFMTVMDQNISVCVIRTQDSFTIT